MSEVADAKLEERVSALEKKRHSSLLAASLSGVLGAVLALLGSWVAFESQEQDRLLKLTEIQANHLDLLNGDYYQRYHAFSLIAAVHGVEVAIDIEPIFRSGATVHALEQLRQVEPEPRLRALIEKHLATVHRVLVVDSKEAYNVYCPETRASIGTN